MKNVDKQIFLVKGINNRNLLKISGFSKFSVKFVGFIFFIENISNILKKMIKTVRVANSTEKYIKEFFF